MTKPLGLSLVLVSLVPSFAAAETTAFSVILAGKNVGHLIAKTKGDLTTVDYDYKNNGRGPTMSEVIRTGAEGLPVEWSIKGTTTFGSKVEEHFSQTGSHAEWMDSTGRGSATDQQARTLCRSKWQPVVGAHSRACPIARARHEHGRIARRNAAPGEG